MSEKVEVRGKAKGCSRNWRRCALVRRVDQLIGERRRVRAASGRVRRARGRRRRKGEVGSPLLLVPLAEVAGQACSRTTRTPSASAATPTAQGRPIRLKERQQTSTGSVHSSGA